MGFQNGAEGGKRTGRNIYKVQEHGSLEVNADENVGSNQHARRCQGLQTYNAESSESEESGDEVVVVDKKDFRRPERIDGLCRPDVGKLLEVVG